MPTKTKADADVYRTGLELRELADDEDWTAEQYEAQTGEEPPELEVGDYVRIQDVHTGISTLYPDARVAQVIDITDENVYFDITNGISHRIADTVRPIEAMQGVLPRGF